MLILAIILLGMVAGGLAQLVLGRSWSNIDWPTAFIAGLIGSFVGGLLLSLLFGHGLSIHPTGLIGSFLGAIVVTFVWGLFSKRD
ncbi:GlsB/YeaQ/YmgE family stress response membrane protein [Nocardioides sp. GY 10113]|uniref:GlsB/YeaQ/YmgE family stress response membrane protein n=1 Tax=Nocardioides sp. GY 10113 TaxID=2569761 RepID=UPI0010A93F4E|nr:GlsB/YeaQ/YmgE family stress response membrane protein [Nocardioides sp. GY 10113]TIC88410.1 GlsB/YeaQ/YmgE family stress response membrane protein [Nocardioides sp. GY 10113]